MNEFTSFFNWMNWFNAITSASMILSSLFIAVLYYSGRTWARSNDKLANALLKVGESVDKVRPELQRLGDNTSDLKVVLGAHAGDFKISATEITNEIRKNRDAISNFDRLFRKIYWFVPANE